VEKLSITSDEADLFEAVCIKLEFCIPCFPPLVGA
jgi:hypothetical protein